jgi:nucleoside-diphosphate-sugar epimerase
MVEIVLNKQHPFYQADIDYVLSMKGIEALKGKRVLITGATGLIGVHLTDVLMRLGQVKVIAVGRNKEKARGRLGEYFEHPDFIFLKQDVLDPFPEELSADIIIPLASNTHPLAYSQYPVETVLINVKGAENALSLANKNGATVLYPSTVEVYGASDGKESFSETDTGRLNLATSRACYTESKRVSEALCQSFLSEYGVESKIVRLPRVFGPTMLGSDTKASSQFIIKSLRGEDVVLKSKGEQFFSYCYVSDAVAAMLFILLHGETGEAYNVSSSSCNIRLRDFAKICAEFNGRQVEFDLPSVDESRGYSIADRAILDSSKLKELGFTPKYGIKEAIERTIAVLG